MGNSNEHIKHIMGESMEALIHHFKLVTEGFRVPPGQAYVPVESPRGELGAHVVSDGGTRPFRAHFRDPSFVNLQAMPAMCEGAMVSDVVVAVASLDPVMGGVDRERGRSRRSARTRIVALAPVRDSEPRNSHSLGTPCRPSGGADEPRRAEPSTGTRVTTPPRS